MGFLTLISILVFPQLFGILLYLRLSGAPRWVAAIAAALAPAVIFFWLARIFLFAGLREYYAGDPKCGMPVMVAVLALYTGTAIQLVLGVITQVFLSVRIRTQSFT